MMQCCAGSARQGRELHTAKPSARQPASRLRLFNLLQGPPRPGPRSSQAAMAFEASQLSPAALEGLGPQASRFSDLLAVQSDLLSSIASAVGAEPVDGGSIQAASPDGKSSMCVQTFKGGKVDLLTAGWAAFSSPVPTGYARLTAWVGPDTEVPHLTVELVFYGDTGLLFTHLIPRKDLVLHPGYLNKYYAQPAPGAGRSFCELEAACEGRAGWRPFKSPQPLVRAFGAGLAVGYWLPPEGLPAAAEVAREAADMWLGFVGDAAVVVPEEEQAALAARDAALRHAAVWGDAHFGAMEAVWGAQNLRRMGELLTGAPAPGNL